MTVEAQQPITTGINLLAELFPVARIRRGLYRARLLIEHGVPWFEALRRRHLIGRRDAGVLEAAQRAGNLAWALRALADSHDRQLGYRLQVLAQLIFPLIVLGVGVLVGLAAVLAAGGTAEVSGPEVLSHAQTTMAGHQLVFAMTTILFLGGWASPINLPPFTWIPGAIWFVIKLGLVFFMFAMVKAFVPRYRYDQLMRIGWKVFLPLSLFYVVLIAFILQLTGWGWHGGIA